MKLKSKNTCVFENVNAFKTAAFLNGVSVSRLKRFDFFNVVKIIFQLIFLYKSFLFTSNKLNRPKK